MAYLQTTADCASDPGADHETEAIVEVTACGGGVAAGRNHKLVGIVEVGNQVVVGS
jgi:hypothetical protein